MNELGWILLGVAARATVLGVLGWIVMRGLQRRGPAASALAGLTTLVVMLAMTVLAASPWPTWWTPSRPLAVAAPLPAARTSSVAEAKESPRRSPRALGASVAADATPSGWATFAADLRRELTRPTIAPSQRARWRWPAGVACLFLGGLIVALIRLMLGLGAVRTLTRSGRVVDDPDLLARVDALRAALGVRRAVAVRETSAVATPATVGWRRPAVLLPPTWSTWTDTERQAVLAHELVHIRRGDYLAGLVAQLSLSLHFYHPLAHVLARRLRLQQELAADARGAMLVGSRRLYLRTLANLALRQDCKPSAWPAQAFLPTRGTFLRRIEMLRDPNFIDSPPLLARTRAALVVALVAAGLTLAGLRGPSGTDRAAAQPPLPASPQVPAVPPVADFLDALALSPEVRLVVDLRPLDLLKIEEFQQLAAQIPADGNREVRLIASGRIEQVLVLQVDGPADAPGARLAFLLRTTAGSDWADLIPAEAERVERDGLTYRKTASGPDAFCYRELDARTLLMAPESWIASRPIDPQQPPARHEWDDAWKLLGPAPLRVALDTPWLAREARAGRGLPAPLLQMVAPLLDQTRAYAGNLELTAGPSLAAVATSRTPDEAKQVTATVQALLTLGRNALPTLRTMADEEPRTRRTVAAVNAAEALLGSARVEQDRSTTRLLAPADSLAPIVAALAPAVTASREAASRAMSINNLKQIGLAMHNFAAATLGTFPPAVLYGPDGKTPHSWRVALLPYLAQQDLYNEYKLDEPWDGPNNRKLIARMPAVFHDPSDDAAPGQSSYFVPTGPRTLFPDRKEGMRIAEVTDGTSHTIMAIEAKRAVPWTKPEDVAIDPAQPLPALGGFHPGGGIVLFADGSVRFLKSSFDPTTLRALLTATGGEVVAADPR